MKDTDNIPLILVGNKVDMSAEREVQTSEGEALAKTLGCEFTEASAKTCVNVEKGGEKHLCLGLTRVFD